MDKSPREVNRIVEPDYVMEGAGVLLRRSFGPKIDNLFDPFLLFDHFAFNDPIEGPIVGFPFHPHRGIETVTYMLEGNTRHRDSLGNSGVIGPGDVQWMTSGRGIMHEEMPKRGPEGRVTGFQLWVNLPADQKMSQPRYQEVTASTIPAVEKDGMKVRVIAGEYDGVRGPVTEIAAKPLYMDVLLQPGVEFSLPVQAEHSAVAYLFDGEGVFGLNLDGQGERVEAVRMVVFGDGDHVRIRAREGAEARFVLIAGGPFREPIMPYGPFVMNTRDEIIQALDELKNGTFVKD
jgi:redox-sensitive bicupin YhaK (pirin superfamily)